jgi:hypothetical protein
VLEVLCAGLDALDGHGAVRLHKLAQIDLGKHVQQLVLRPVDDVRLKWDGV